MLCLMSLYYGIFIFMAFSLQLLLFVLPLAFTRIYPSRVTWWPIYCFLSEFVLSPALKHFGEVLFDIRYDRFVFVPSPNSFTQLSRTHMLIIEFCIWVGLFGGHFKVKSQKYHLKIDLSFQKNWSYLETKLHAFKLFWFSVNLVKVIDLHCYET